MQVVYDHVVRMSYCRRCRGEYQADVHVVATNYGLDTYVTYKTLRCDCETVCQNPPQPIAPQLKMDV